MRHLLSLSSFLLGMTIACLTFSLGSSAMAAENDMLRVGIIGLDTSHAPAFTKAFNSESADDDSESAEDDLKHCRVVAAYPHGSRDIESSVSRIPQYTEQLREMGIEITDSVDELLSKVDCVLLETNDGRRHLEQALKVFRAGKPVFIDKPLGADLSQVVAIVRAAEHYQVPMFSSSSLRYTSGAQAIRGGSAGRVLGCSAYSPCSIEETHVELFWYGIHGVEILYTCMGTGCETVRHTSTDDFEFALGRWSDGRLGTFRGIKTGQRGYGGTAFGDESIQEVGSYEGYQPLVAKIATFFRTHQTPVEASETIELYAFMQAALASKNRDGEPVKITEVMDRAEQQASELLQGELTRVE